MIAKGTMFPPPFHAHLMGMLYRPKCEGGRVRSHVSSSKLSLFTGKNDFLYTIATLFSRINKRCDVGMLIRLRQTFTFLPFTSPKSVICHMTDRYMGMFCVPSEPYYSVTRYFALPPLLTPKISTFSYRDEYDGSNFASQQICAMILTCLFFRVCEILLIFVI